MTADAAVVFVVDADPRARDETEEGLRRRFGADYRILAVDSAETGLATLEQLAREGAEVALIAADLQLPNSGGVAFLERARSVYPCATRVLLVAMDDRGTRIPLGSLEPIQPCRAAKGSAIPTSVMTNSLLGTKKAARVLGPRKFRIAWSR